MGLRYSCIHLLDELRALLPPQLDQCGAVAKDRVLGAIAHRLQSVGAGLFLDGDLRHGAGAVVGDDGKRFSRGDEAVIVLHYARVDPDDVCCAHDGEIEGALIDEPHRRETGGADDFAASATAELRVEIHFDLLRRTEARELFVDRMSGGFRAPAKAREEHPNPEAAEQNSESDAEIPIAAE